MTNNNKKTTSPLFDLIPLITGEAIVVALTCVGFIIVHFLGLYELRLSSVLGALLGAAVILINHAVLIFSVDKQHFIKRKFTGHSLHDSSILSDVKYIRHKNSTDM